MTGNVGSKIAVLSILLAGFGMHAASATTLTFKSAGSNGVYPYNNDIGSATTTTVMDCLNDTRTIYTNETWTVTATDLQGFSGSIDGATHTQLDEDAYLDSLYGDGLYSNSDIQHAIWDIEDSSDYWSLDSTSKTLVGNAVSFVGSTTDSNSFYAQFTVYTPTQWPWRDGEPQQMIQYTPHVSPTPEPSSLMLLGTGIVGAAALMRRRMTAVTIRG